MVFIRLSLIRLKLNQQGYSDQRWCLGYIANDQRWAHPLRNIIKVFGGSTGHGHTKDKHESVVPRPTQTKISI